MTYIGTQFFLKKHQVQLLLKFEFLGNLADSNPAVERKWERCNVLYEYHRYYIGLFTVNIFGFIFVWLAEE